MTLSQTQLRVLGALLEKEIVTPENYPLSLNALVNACNQKSSRDPVLELSEDEVRRHCAANLTGYKRPKVIEFRSDLPKSPVGKVLRRELREPARVT